jgi:hypothetical protein
LIANNYSLAQQWWTTGIHYYQAVQVIVSVSVCDDTLRR